MPAPIAILVHQASTHNLRAVDCRIPHRQVTVVTGPSGAGKSSLAFDTIFAEGQRRFVESMSTYARQFLDQMERPPVESIEHILPAVALAANNSIRNARSTVGTITEAHDVLRLLYTHLGEVRCPRGHGPVRRLLPGEAADLLAAGAVGESFLVVARLPRPKKRANEALAELVRQGFARRLTATGEVERMAQRANWPTAWATLPIVLGRFRAGETSQRLAETVEEAYRLGAGRAEAHAANVSAGDPEGASSSSGSPRQAGGLPSLLHLSRELGCPICGETARRPTPALFSFNSPLGACATCQGFGRTVGIDRARVIPDPTKTLREKPIAPWNTPSYEGYYRDLFTAAQRCAIRLDTPWQELSDEERGWVWSGAGKQTNLDDFFGWLEQRTYKVQARVLLARYRSYDTCASCGGARLNADSRAVELHGKPLPVLTAMSIEALAEWLTLEPFTLREHELAGHLLLQLGERLSVLRRVGLDYLTLDRQARTLSGGESQRIHLAAALGSGMTSTLYVLDEPTIGLHPQDSAKLVALLRDLAARGNTVLVVEHDRTLIAGADHVIDLGPAAGEHGGRVVAEGTFAEILAHPDSLTGRYLRERPATHAREHLARFRREHRRDTVADELASRPMVTIRGARAHNLGGFDVSFPLASLVAVVGTSGSGKSTLVENVLHANYQRGKGVVDVDPGQCDGIDGLEHVADLVMVDQSPLGRSARSNPVTYVKAYDDIRKLFAATAAARNSGIGAGHFSFNLDLGRCKKCEGTGVLEVDMQFMAPVAVVCEECRGQRFRPEVLRVRWRDRSIHQVLELTVDSALELFAEHRGLRKKLQALADVGLGYLRLGQSTSTLSGGEAQRLKLASFLQRPTTLPGRGAPRPADDGLLFLFDEPTTGLHLADIDLLYGTIRRLVQRGDSVVVVEHSLDLVARADWIIDLGPGGGWHGGKLLFSGPLEVYLDTVESPTAGELRSHLRWTRPPLASRGVGEPADQEREGAATVVGVLVAD